MRAGHGLRIFDLSLDQPSTASGPLPNRLHTGGILGIGSLAGGLKENQEKVLSLLTGMPHIARQTISADD
jgi:hypothetical protein